MNYDRKEYEEKLRIDAALKYNPMPAPTHAPDCASLTQLLLTNPARPAACDCQDKVPSALDVQVAGKHYKDMAIQPVEFIHANGIGYFEGNVIKYVSRWRAKGGVADLEKAKHYIDLLIELESKK